MRLTKQRKIMLECLQSLKTHPTADELYPILKQRLPSISLCSVYRNLSTLASKKKVLILEGCGPSMRFDGCTKKHIHLICKNCGAIEDYEGENAYELTDMIKKIISDNPRLKSWNLTLEGLCSSCYNNKNQHKLKE